MILVSMFAFIVARSVVEKIIEQSGRNKRDNGFEQLKADAVGQHPDAPVSEAIRQESVESATKKLNVETDAQKRAQSAAAMFWGFLFVNTRERAEFCREQGVDIQPFVSAFEQAHANQIAKAKSILARTATDEEKLYTEIEPLLRKAVVQDMNDIATAKKISLKSACQFISNNALALAGDMHISKVQPTVYNALMSGN